MARHEEQQHGPSYQHFPINGAKLLRPGTETGRKISFNSPLQGLYARDIGVITGKLQEDGGRKATFAEHERVIDRVNTR